MRLATRMIFASSLVALVGCNESTSSTGTGPTFHKDIRPLIDQNCAMCHKEGGIAPFSLLDYAKAVEKKMDIKIAVSERIMPPWLAKKGCTDYFADRSLSDDEIKLFTDWVDAGAREGNPKDYVAPATMQQIKLSRVDMTAKMAQAYMPQKRPDDYRCFVVDWPETTTKFVSGFRANPGSHKIVHHVIAFLATPDQVSRVMQLEAEDATPGYQCFGDARLGNNTRWIGGWAPGGDGSDFPPGTGLKVEPGSKIILQVHYNTSENPPEPDQTSVDVKLDDTVTKEAAVQPFTNFAWITQRTMDIPAGMPDVMHSYRVDPSPYWSLLTDGVFDNGKPVTIWSASLHMHVRGVSAVTRIQRADQTTDCMLDIPRWDFHWQGSYGFAQPKVLNPGDRLYLECHWDNSKANQPYIDDVQMDPIDLNWGEGTNDEMCLAGFYLTQ